MPAENRADLESSNGGTFNMPNHLVLASLPCQRHRQLNLGRGHRSGGRRRAACLSCSAWVQLQIRAGDD